MSGVLTALIVLPLAGAAAAAGVDARQERALRVVGLVSSGLTFLVAAWVWLTFRSGVATLQFVEHVPWVPSG